MTVVHYSVDQITSVYDVSQYDRRRLEARFLRKPDGLWFAEDGKWKESAGGWRGDPATANRYLINLDRANVITISDLSEMERFTARFCQGLGNSRHDEWCPFIRWHEVAEIADGVHVAVDPWEFLDPSEYKRRFDWLAGWDIASGCVWKLDKVRVLDSSGAAVPYDTTRVRAVGRSCNSVLVDKSSNSEIAA